MMYSVLLINSGSVESLLSVHGRTAWKTKRTAMKHKRGIEECSSMPFDTVAVELITTEQQINK